jgi:hypothetical protein
MGKQRTDKADRYFQLHHYMLKTDAWKALSPPARAVYIQIGSRYDGFNNGRLAFSVRDAASECDINKDTAGRAFHELVARLHRGDPAWRVEQEDPPRERVAHDGLQVRPHRSIQNLRLHASGRPQLQQLYPPQKRSPARFKKAIDCPN